VPETFGRAFAIGIALNAAFVVVEAGYGFAAGSMALIADAGHNLTDVLGLVVAWLGAWLSRKPPSRRYTYGLRGTSILAALFNGMLLMLAVGAIVWEAIQRLMAPEPVATTTMMAVAGLGILVNAGTAWLFSGGHGDINVRGAYLHMAADAGVSAGVVLAALGILATGWTWLDPLTSLLIAGVIVWTTWDLLRDSFDMAIAAVPAQIGIADVRGSLEGLPGVTSIHDLHVWPVSTTETALTVHLVMPQGCPGDDFLGHIGQMLRDRHGIGHATVQVERDGSACPLAPDHVL
jgi:cobalt-zinc-cadmium efflux system protein